MIIIIKSFISRFLVVSLLVLILTTACSAGITEVENIPPAEEASQQLNTSSSAVLPKDAGEVVQESEVINKQSVGNPQAQEAIASKLPVDTYAEIEPTAVVVQPTPVVIQPSLEATPVVIQPAQQPQIDLSLPVGPRVGSRAPEFLLQTLDGQSVQISGLYGAPFIMSYWATWCVPCMNELSILGRIYSDYQQQGLKIVTINAIEQDSVDKVQQTVNEMGMSFPVLLDVGDQFANAYQAIFFPTTFYVDETGVIREIVLGDTTEEEFRKKIEQLLSHEL